MIWSVKKMFLVCLFAVLFIGTANAQNTNINPASVNVEALSDAQIEKLISEMEKNGMSLEEAMALARARGASQLQIDQMVKKINEYKSGKTKRGNSGERPEGRFKSSKGGRVH